MTTSSLQLTVLIPKKLPTIPDTSLNEDVQETLSRCQGKVHASSSLRDLGQAFQARGGHKVVNRDSDSAMEMELHY